jgi:hypothetical protein
MLAPYTFFNPLQNFSIVHRLRGSKQHGEVCGRNMYPCPWIRNFGFSSCIRFSEADGPSGVWPQRTPIVVIPSNGLYADRPSVLREFTEPQSAPRQI